MEMISEVTLPDNVETLQKLLLKKKDIIRGKDHYIAELQKVNDILKDQLRLQKKHRYGSSSEKWTDKDKEHMLLFDEAELEADTPLAPVEEELITVSAYTYKSKKEESLCQMIFLVRK